MKITFLFMLLANVALGIWGYMRAAEPPAAPPPYRPARLVHWAPPASPKPAPPVAPQAPAVPQAPAAPKSSHAAPETSSLQPMHCWRFGPFRSHAQAAAFLLHRHGAVEVRPGRVAAYRVFLSAAVSWPDRVHLEADGVRGAYVTRGPRGGRILSLGVFNNEAATRRYRSALLHDGLHTLQAALVTPSHYYVHLFTVTPLPAGIAVMPHAACAAPPRLH